MAFIAASLLVRKFNGNTRYTRLLIFSCLLMCASWYLPSPLIEGNDTAFTTHLIGGGVFTGLLWLYLKLSLKLQGAWHIEVVSLFALVSMLGVLNELFEIGLYTLNIMKTINDTSWDLLANTLGVVIFYVGYAVFVGITRSRRHDSRH